MRNGLVFLFLEAVLYGNYRCSCFKRLLKLPKASCSFNDSKWRRMARLSKKTINFLK